jgi:hypothetical protein
MGDGFSRRPPWLEWADHKWKFVGQSIETREFIWRCLKCDREHRDFNGQTRIATGRCPALGTGDK